MQRVQVWGRGIDLKNWCSQKIGVAGSHFSARGYAISFIIVVAIE